MTWLVQITVGTLDLAFSEYIPCCNLWLEVIGIHLMMVATKRFANTRTLFTVQPHTISICYFHDGYFWSPPNCGVHIIYNTLNIRSLHEVFELRTVDYRLHWVHVIVFRILSMFNMLYVSCMYVSWMRWRNFIQLHKQTNAASYIPRIYHLHWPNSAYP